MLLEGKDQTGSHIIITFEYDKFKGQMCFWQNLQHLYRRSYIALSSMLTERLDIYEIYGFCMFLPIIQVSYKNALISS